MKKAAFFLSFLVSLAGLTSAACAYPNGTPHYVTDTGPFCAACHTVPKREYMPELPDDAAARELTENKHYGLVKMPLPPSPYVELTEAEKARIIDTAKKIDSAATVSISAPAKAAAGSEIKVTVKVRGGNGPAIGVMLVDRASRFQSRPPSASGWAITGEPAVAGQDGKPQKAWLDRRAKGMERNLNYIMIEDQKFDLETGVFPEGTVTYTLKAPSKPGRYPLTAAFLYGTENAGSAAFFQRPSGRILFSGETTVQVE